MYPPIPWEVFAIIHAQEESAPVLADGESWALTRAMSPRATVRVAAMDAYGQAMNLYDSTARVAGGPVDRPWAVYLAGADHRFRLLCFDLDAKTAAGRAGVARDVGVLREMLVGAGLDSVVCESGPTGGRHVWAALAESVDAETVATLGRFAKRLCPTLDLSPLSNPRTGCVRPPGAPHRSGGHSTPISGNVGVLGRPTGTAASVQMLVERLAALIDDGMDVETPTTGGAPLPQDKHARLSVTA